MKPHHKALLDRLGWDGWHGNDRPAVDGEDKDVDEMLTELRRRVEDRLDEYEERQRFTPPSRERREARQRARYRIQQQPDHPPVSGSA